MTNLDGLNSLILATLFFSEINSCNFFVGKHISNDNKVIDGNLIKNIHVIFVILVNDKSNMSTWILEV